MSNCDLLVSSFRFGPDWEECLQAVSDEGQTARDMVAPAKIVSNADHCGLDYIVIHMICLYIFIGRLCPNSVRIAQGTPKQLDPGIPRCNGELPAASCQVPDDAIPSAKHHYRWTELLQVTSPDIA